MAYENVKDQQKYFTQFGVKFSDYGNGVQGGYKVDTFGFPNTTTGLPVNTFTNTYLAAGGGTFNAAVFDSLEPLRTGRFLLKVLKIPPIIDKQVIPMFKFFFEYAVRSFSGLSSVTLETATGVPLGPTREAPSHATITKDGNNNFTIQCLVTKGGGIIKLLEYWVYGISDPMTGLATMNGKNIPFSRSNYGATFIYVMLGPTGRPDDIEFAQIYHEAFPTTIPYELYESGEQGQVDVTPTYDIEMQAIAQHGPEVDLLAASVVALSMTHSTSYQDQPLSSYMYDGYLNSEIIQNRDFQVSVGNDFGSRSQQDLKLNPGGAIYSEEQLANREGWRDIKGLNDHSLADSYGIAGALEDVYKNSDAQELISGS